MLLKLNITNISFYIRNDTLHMYTYGISSPSVNIYNYQILMLTLCRTHTTYSIHLKIWGVCANIYFWEHILWNMWYWDMYTIKVTSMENGEYSDNLLSSTFQTFKKVNLWLNIKGNNSICVKNVFNLRVSRAVPRSTLR